MTQQQQQYPGHCIYWPLILMFRFVDLLSLYHKNFQPFPANASLWRTYKSYVCFLYLFFSLMQEFTLIVLQARIKKNILQFEFIHCYRVKERILQFSLIQYHSSNIQDVARMVIYNSSDIIGELKEEHFLLCGKNLVRQIMFFCQVR